MHECVRVRMRESERVRTGMRCSLEELRDELDQRLDQRREEATRLCMRMYADAGGDAWRRTLKGEGDGREKEKK
jgi:hypothetical protein